MNQHVTKDKKKTWNLCYGFLILEEKPPDIVKKINDSKSDQSIAMNKIHPGVWILDYQRLVKKIRYLIKKRTKN
ncbi:MAG: hypothetical protein ACLRVU_06865 [Beduini sp.]|uniref:hypothetical protein n=1 Tax=Beduini sp. TaxID=1922300 RepID=UPI0039A0EFFD